MHRSNTGRGMHRSAPSNPTKGGWLASALWRAMGRQGGLTMTEPAAPTTQELLPFVSRRADGAPGLCFWAVDSSGNWAEDCRTGERYAAAYIERLLSDPLCPILLCRIVRDMIGGGQYTGIEAGFMSVIQRAMERPHEVLAQ